LKTAADFNASHPSSAWKLINSITGHKKSPPGKISGKTTEERRQQWFSHFKSLLGTRDERPSPHITPVLENLDIKDSDFTMAELLAAKKQILEGKAPEAPGYDGMPEVIKRADIDDILLGFANKIGDLPSQLGSINLLPIPKSGSHSAVKNINTLDGKNIAQALFKNGVQDFKYLGSWVEQLHDILTRKALAWSALRKLEKV